MKNMRSSTFYSTASPSILHHWLQCLRLMKDAVQQHRKGHMFISPDTSIRLPNWRCGSHLYVELIISLWAKYKINSQRNRFNGMKLENIVNWTLNLWKLFLIYHHKNFSDNIQTYSGRKSSDRKPAAQDDREFKGEEVNDTTLLLQCMHYIILCYGENWDNHSSEKH